MFKILEIVCTIWLALPAFESALAAPCVGAKGDGNTVSMHCQGELVPSLSDPSTQELLCANEVIQKDFAFGSLKLAVDEKALREALLFDEKRGYAISLSQATQLALTEIFDDFDTIESPLSLAAMGWSETTGQNLSSPLTADQKRTVSAFLRTQMQNQKTSLSLFTGTIVKGLSYPPEQGETFESNWIFVLRIPSLSDHIYWIVVDKEGLRAPYLYGFN